MKVSFCQPAPWPPSIIYALSITSPLRWASSSSVDVCQNLARSAERGPVFCVWAPEFWKKNLAQLMTSHDISWHLMTSYDPLSLWPFVPLLRVQSWGACFKPSWQPNSSPSQAWCPFDWIALATWGSQGTPDTTPNSESMWKQSDFAQDRFEKGTSKKAGPELGHSKLNYKVVSISIIVLCSH